jgi:DNA mismatch endonuclease (patch repair protein)
MAKAAKRSGSELRSYTMSRIRGESTSIEIAFRKALWREGIRYRKNYKALPGKPDIAITKWKIAVFCDGGFWHGKDWKRAKSKIKSNREYWIAKIERNLKRDKEVNQDLKRLGWTVLRFWDKDIKKNLGACVEEVRDAMALLAAEEL